MPNPTQNRPAVLSRGGLAIKCVPDLGGRIMEFSLDGYNYLFVNPLLEGAKNDQPEPSWDGVWRNFGGEKIWPAPQGWDNDRQWAGPPDKVLDGGFFTLVSADENSFSTLSPICPRTGLRIARTVSLLEGECGARVEAEFENFSEKDGEWSVWPVIQVAAPEDGRFAITFPEGGGYRIMHGLVNSPQYSREGKNCRVDYQYIIGKVGADTGADWWAAYADLKTGKVFAASARYVEGAKYPGGTNVQIWSAGRGAVYSRGVLRIAPDDRAANPPYMEIELLSPLEKMKKGAKTRFTYFMRACTVPAGDTVKRIAGCAAVSRELSAEVIAGGAARVSARLGAFAQGYAILKNSKGKILSREEVSPSCGAEISAEIAQGQIGENSEIILEYFNGGNKLTIGRIKL